MSTLTKEDLLALGALFDQALEIEDADGYDPLPDGEYVCEVVKAEIKKTKNKKDDFGREIENSGRLMGSWHFKIAEGEEGANRRIFKNLVLEDNPRNMKRFLNDISKFGHDVSSIQEALGVLEALTGEVCMVQLRTNDKGGQWASIDVPEE